MCKHNVKRKTQEKTVFQKSKCPCLKIVEHQEPVSRRNDTVASISFLWLLKALQRKYHSRKIKWSKKKIGLWKYSGVACSSSSTREATCHRCIQRALTKYSLLYYSFRLETLISHLTKVNFPSLRGFPSPRFGPERLGETDHAIEALQTSPWEQRKLAKSHKDATGDQWQT